ncbi:MAG: leucine-rich repeat protein [Clostridia bacterium]|nr:leucine-rich repeat protein [Clostridia bacterium]
MLLLSLLLTVCVSAEATGACGNDLTWSFNETTGELSISGTGAMTDYTSSDGNRAPWYSYASSITKITVGEGVTSIGTYAFNTCAVTEVSLPDTLKVIGGFAFRECRSLTKISIPSGVTEIKSYTFNFCSKLASVTFSEGLKKINNAAFNYCNVLSSVVFPASLDTLGKASGSAFINSAKLAELTFLNADTEILGGLPTGVTTIYGYADGKVEDYATKNGIKFEALTPDEPESPRGTCGANLEWVLYDGNHLSITGEGAMSDYANSEGNHAPWYSYASSITKITIAEGVTSVGKYAFNTCAVSEIVLPDTLSKISSFAFRECKALTAIDFPSSVEVILNYAFNNCTALASVTFSEGLKMVEHHAFNNCRALSGTIVIPSSVTLLTADTGGVSAFNGCTGITALKFLSADTTISGNLPSGIATIYGYAGGSVEAYSVDKGITFVALDKPFAYDCTTVFEMTASAVKAPAGELLTIASLEREGLAATKTLNLLAVDELGALYLYTADGGTTALLNSQGEAIVLADGTAIAIVYNDKNGTARFYVNEFIPRYGLDLTLAVNVSVASDNFLAIDSVSDNAILADGITLNNHFPVEEASASYAGFQISESGTDLRILGGIDMLYYDSVGFVIELYSNDILQGSMTETVSTVFSSIIADGTTTTANELGFNYLTAVIISNIDRTDYSAADNVYFKITPFSTIGGEKLYGRYSYITITTDNGKHIYTSGIAAPFVPTLRFVATSDIHFTDKPGTNAANFKSIIDQLSALVLDENKNDGYTGLDAVLMAGDITSYGTVAELNAAKDYLDANIPEGTELVITMGNHDWLDWKNVGPAQSLAQFEDAFGEATKDTVIGGYHFITLCCDNFPAENASVGYGWDYSDMILAKAEQMIAAALADTGPNKPIFIIQHIPNADTVAGSNVLIPRSTLEALESKYSNLIIFAGHSHFTVNDECSIHQESYTTVGTGALSMPQAQLVEVDAYGRVRIRQYDALAESFVGEIWLIGSYDPVDFIYTEDRFESTDLFFAEGAEITVTDLGATTATISFLPVPAESLTARAYKIVLSNAEGEIISTAFLETEYFKENYTTPLTFNFESLTSLAEYTASVYAINPLYDLDFESDSALASTPLTVTFTPGT